ncbi:MAG: hypothetical protein IKO19_06795 [Candidatus Riflebacteria bacterium]|nr:hypothetical protein [Candidatus Riflebacteria bacterium]
MSGMKEGQIKAAMSRLGEFLDRYEKISAESCQRLHNINNNAEAEKAKRDAQNAIAALQNPSQTAMQFAGDEIKDLNQQKAALNAAINEAEELNRQASDLEKEAAGIRSKNDDEKNKLLRRIEEINTRAQHKINTTSWVNLALDQEVHETNAVREKVTNLTARERKAVKLLEQAADLRRQAVSKFKNIARNGNSAEESLKAIEVIAQNKQKTQDESKAYKEEIDQRLAALSNIDYERFAPGAINQINNQINTFNKAFTNKDYETCTKTGKGVVDALKEFVKNVKELKNKFEEAETNTKDHLKAAMNEFDAVDKAELKRWSGKASEVDKNYGELVKASDDINEASKKGNRPNAFAAPDSKISAAVSALRDLIELANQNKHKFQERDAVRKAIVKALKQQNYDKPVAYYNDKLPDGSPAELSEMVIYAQNPASTGDMRLRIDLEGKIGLEIFRHDKDGNEEEVTKQDAHSCHNSVKKLGENLREAGFNFEITNWGKAEGLEDTQQTSRMPIPSRESERQQERLRERVQERDRQRY